MTEHYDVVIVGAGVAGCAAAIALTQRSPTAKLLLLERKTNETKPRYRIGETLPPHTSTLLQQLGLLESFQAQGNMPAHGTRAIWGSETLQEHTFLYSPYGHGWHLDRSSFDNWLISQAQQRGVTLITGQMITQQEYYADSWSIRIADQSISAKVIIDASGRSAHFGRSQGSQIIKLDQLIGIYRFYQLTDDNNNHDSYTLVESNPFGWWYSSYLPNKQLVVTLMTDSDIAQEQGLLTEHTWTSALQETKQSSQRLIGSEAITSLEVKPAHSQHLSPVCGTAWFATGDAASTFDPLSSLGIFKALRHGLIASYAADDFIQGKSDCCKKYQQFMGGEYRDYLKTREDYYRVEGRFDGELFWRRRGSGGLL